MIGCIPADSIGWSSAQNSYSSYSMTSQDRWVGMAEPEPYAIPSSKNQAGDYREVPRNPRDCPMHGSLDLPVISGCPGKLLVRYALTHSNRVTQNFWRWCFEFLKWSRWFLTTASLGAIYLAQMSHFQICKLRHRVGKWFVQNHFNNLEHI